MRVLVVENYADTPLGQVEAALDEAGARRVHVRPFNGDRLPPNAEEFDALIVLGGAQNALDDVNHPWFPETLDLIKDFERRDRSVLGICLGSQLIARAYGSENRIGGHYEFGWHQMAKDVQAADDDPVFASLPESFPIFEWHDDHFSLPPQAVRLATSPIAQNQAYRIGRAVYGTQFHFEAHQSMVDAWSRTFAPLLAEREPDWQTRRGSEAAIHGEAADSAGLAIASAWVATIEPTN